MEEELTDIVHLMHPKWIWRMCWNIRLARWQFLDPTSAAHLDADEGTRGGCHHWLCQKNSRLSRSETAWNCSKRPKNLADISVQNGKIYVDTIRFPSWIRFSIPYYQGPSLVERQPRSTAARISHGLRSLRFSRSCPSRNSRKRRHKDFYTSHVNWSPSCPQKPNLFRPRDPRWNSWNWKNWN